MKHDDKILTVGYSFVSEDGVFVRVEETPERERVILSLFRNSKTETASINKDMFDALMELRYKIDIRYPVKEGAEKKEDE